MLSLFGPPDPKSTRGPSAGKDPMDHHSDSSLSDSSICDVSWIVDQMENALRRVGDVKVVGELSSFRPWRSGNWFFDLKDEKHTVPCIMPRRYASRMKFHPEDGMQILVSASVTLYRPQTKAQLMVKDMQRAGRGVLLEALERLRAKLRGEGIFDEECKKKLPAVPRVVGLVTSPQGAAILDMIKVLRARSPGISIICSPTRVQGEGASTEIASAITRLDQSGLVDLMIVGRGGGALEDLMSFQMESVVRAIAACNTPVISAVGHESDHTLTDDVADVRAATPSHAAELAVPRLEDLLSQLRSLQRRMSHPILQKVSSRQNTLANLERRLGEPRQQLYTARDALRDHWQALQDAMQVKRQQQQRSLLGQAKSLGQQAPRKKLSGWRKRCHGTQNALAHHHPGAAVRAARLQLAHHLSRLQDAMAKRQQEAESGLAKEASRLHALSPLAVLHRGYSLVRRPQGDVVMDAAQLRAGEDVHLVFRSGEVLAKVEEVLPAPEEPRADHNARKSPAKDRLQRRFQPGHKKTKRKSSDRKELDDAKPEQKEEERQAKRKGAAL